MFCDIFVLFLVFVASDKYFGICILSGVHYYSTLRCQLAIGEADLFTLFSLSGLFDNISCLGKSFFYYICSSHCTITLPFPVFLSVSLLSIK